MKLNLGQDSEARFGQDFEFKFCGDADVWLRFLLMLALVEILKMKCDQDSGLHKLWYPVVRDRSTWSKFGAHGERGDVFLFSNLGAL